MARASRYFISGCAWHFIHCCHNREFFLKSKKDKKRWMYWIFDAKQRFRLCILNFTFTSNHLHLLVYDTEPYGCSRRITHFTVKMEQERILIRILTYRDHFEVKTRLLRSKAGKNFLLIFMTSVCWLGPTPKESLLALVKAFRKELREASLPLQETVTVWDGSPGSPTLLLYQQHFLGFSISKTKFAIK